MEAPETSYRRADRFLRTIGVRDVTGQGQDAVITANGSDLGGGLLEPVFVDVQHCDPGPGAHQGHRHRAAQADGAAGAGYDGDLPGQGPVQHSALLHCSACAKTP